MVNPADWYELVTKRLDYEPGVHKYVNLDLRSMRKEPKMDVEELTETLAEKIITDVEQNTRAEDMSLTDAASVCRGIAKDLYERAVSFDEEAGIEDDEDDDDEEEEEDDEFDDADDDPDEEE